MGGSTLKSQIESASKYEKYNVNMAKKLDEEGRVFEAILCLEEEVEINQQKCEALKLLGVLYEDNDQDDLAVYALK